MQDFGTKADNSPPPGGQLSAAEFNNLATENENAVLRSGQALSGASETQMAQSLFLHAVKSESFQDSGAANAYVATPVSGVNGVLLPGAYTNLSGAVISFKAAATNTAASTLNVGQTTGTLLGTKPIRTQTDTVLPAGSIVGGQYVQLVYNAAFDSGGGAWEFLPWSEPDISQAPSALNIRMVVSIASATSAVTADSVTVNTALGGKSYNLASYNKSINLATTGSGGMDTGTAPVSGWVALYAIYNPVTQTSGIIAQNSPNAIMTEVYSGANMPAGFTASALLTVVPTNASSQFKIVVAHGRRVYTELSTLFSGSATVTNNPISIASSVPANAKSIFGELAVGSSALSFLSLTLYPDDGHAGQQNMSTTVGAGQSLTGNYANLPITIAQQMSFTSSSSAGTPSFNIFSSGYKL